MTDDLARANAVIAGQARLIDELQTVCADLRLAYSNLRETNRALVAENEALRARLEQALARLKSLDV